MPFTHLHLHTEYSLLDGANRIATLPARIKELGMDACAITDHGVMYGVVEFYKACRKAGVKPIIGCEVYVAKNGRFNKTATTDKATGHLILLAETNEGLKNLNYLVSMGFLEGFYYKPRIDRALLREHSKGLIALSACMSGEVPQAILAGDRALAIKLAKEYNEIMGEGNFFFELQSNGIPEQERVNRALRELSKELGIPLVATNDAHYTNKEDARAHDILLCMQTGRKVNDTDRMRMQSDAFYVKSPEEMEAAFRDCPEAIANTEAIAQRCNVELDFDTIHLPSFETEDGSDHDDYLRRLCYDRLDGRARALDTYSRKDYTDRLDHELAVISRMGYTDYFLIVWDFIRFAKEKGIMVGPGRGSGAGSLVAYCIGITNIDPLRYSLLFERFLNPERVSMPDFDIDFCYERRGEVIDYVNHKYGLDHVAQVITFGTLAARACVRDVCRALDVPYSDTDRLAKMIPNELGMTLDKALDCAPELKQAYDNDEVTREVIDTARLFEGMPRHASTHAAGVVISGRPIVEIAPLAKNDESVVVQYAKNNIEDIGLLKFDFLGLRTLTVLQDTRAMVLQNGGPDIDFDALPMDDPAVYKMISDGDTAGVFQLESSGMTAFMKELKPSSLEDIIAGVSLFRPGPMKQIPRYVAARHDPTTIHYDHPLLQPILDVTYGCMVYQEQVMQIVRDLAGFTLGQSDNIRRAMSKKKPELLETYKNLFIRGGTSDDGKEIDGAIKRGVPEPVAEKIWNEVMDFAGYAFNKSHAAAYAVVAYYTAWLKRYWPVEFMAAMLNSYMGNLSQAANYIQVCKDMGIAVLPPDINRSQVKFTTENGAIRIGMGAVKNAGTAALGELVRERMEGGEYKTFGDFLTRTAALSINRKMIESLIRASAMDGFGVDRNKLIAAVEPYLNRYSKQKHAVMDGQMSLFDLSGQAPKGPPEPDYPEVPVMPRMLRLADERDMLGVYVTGHPLEDYREGLKHYTDLDCSMFRENRGEDEEEGHGDPGPDGGSRSQSLDGRRVLMGGMITRRVNKTTRKNEGMCFLTLEDMSGRFEVLVFPKVMSELNPILQEQQVIVVRGRISESDDQETKLIADSAAPLPEDRQLKTEEAALARSALDILRQEKGVRYPMKEGGGRYPRQYPGADQADRRGQSADGPNAGGQSADGPNASEQSADGPNVGGQSADGPNTGGQRRGPAAAPNEAPPPPPPFGPDPSQRHHTPAFVIAFDGNETDDEYRRLIATIRYFQGSTPAFIYLKSAKRLLRMPARCGIEPDPYFLRLMNHRYGEENVAMLDFADLDRKATEPTARMVFEQRDFSVE